MDMSNEYRYLKSILFNYFAGHGTGVHCVDKKHMGIHGRENFPHKKLAIPRMQKFISGGAIAQFSSLVHGRWLSPLSPKGLVQLYQNNQTQCTHKENLYILI